MFCISNISNKQERHYISAIFIGIIAGIISALVKSGFEDLFPARAPYVTPPPVVLLEKFGVDVSAMNYDWLGTTINWGGNGIHILFSIVVAVIYCVIVEYFPKSRLFHGVFFGIGVSVFAHGLIVPLLGLSGWLWTAGAEPIISEFVGTAFWIWSIEAIRQDLRASLLKKSHICS